MFDTLRIDPFLIEACRSQMINRDRHFILVTEILNLLRPKTLVTSLAPRVWITIKKEKFEKFKEGQIPLPLDSSLTGETDIFLSQKVNLPESEELTLGKFDEIVDYPNSLPPFYALLGNILRKILSAPNQGPWRIPPLRLLKDMPPRIILPSALERCVNGNYRFEFFVAEPPPYTLPDTDSKFAALYNLFIVGWQFRWRVVEQHIREMSSTYRLREPIARPPNPSLFKMSAHRPAWMIISLTPFIQLKLTFKKIQPEAKW